MTARLTLPDATAWQDLSTYVARALALDGEGAMRLQADGPALAAYVCALPGTGLMGEGSVLGLRVLRLSGPAEVDVTVSLRALAGRLVRRADDGVLSLPPVELTAAWAAIGPPRGGWEPVGSVPVATLRAVAVAGVEEIATGSPEGSGGHAVRALRQAVWQRETTTVPPVPAGAAFAAYALGFLAGEAATVHANGRWTRVSTPVGHLLLR